MRNVMGSCLLRTWVVEPNIPVFKPDFDIESIVIWANDVTSLKPSSTYVKMAVIVVSTS